MDSEIAHVTHLELESELKTQPDKKVFGGGLVISFGKLSMSQIVIFYIILNWFYRLFEENASIASVITVLKRVGSNFYLHYGVC